jgi:uncharacterized protein
MPRPRKCRRVAFSPEVTYFKPAGIPLRMLDEVDLTIEELEAIRLKDLEGLEQEEGAQRMNVSRPTFQRMLTSARHKLAEALLQGKAIRIGGGTFELNTQKCRCLNQHEWQAVPGKPDELECPVCNSKEIMKV